MADPSRDFTRTNSIIRFLILVLTSFVVVVCHLTFTIENEYATTVMVGEGIAEVPYQFRVLFAKASILFGHLVSVKPPAAENGNLLFLMAVGYSKLVCGIIACLCIGKGVERIGRYFGLTAAQAWWASYLILPVLLAILLLPLILGRVPIYYVSDLPSIAFFTWALHSILRGSFRWLAFLIVLGTFNRGTMLLALWPFVMLGIEREQKIKAFFQSFLLVLLYSGVMGGLWFVYRDNPGRAVHLSILGNLNKLISVDIFLAIAALTISGLLPTLFLRNYLPIEYRRLLSCVTPYMALILFSGAISETRIYGELVPLGWLGMVLGLRRFGWAPLRGAQFR